MAGIVESYKKVYENKKIHIGLFVVALLWTISSILLDVATGHEENFKQNIFDLIFGLFVGAHSLQFLHNAINNINSGELPTFRDIKKQIYWGMIKLDVVWSIYAAVILLTAIIIYTTLINSLILPIIIFALTAFVAIFVYYIYLAYADNLDTKGLFNIALIFKFIKPTIKNTLIKLCLFILVTLLALLICILFYAAVAITGVDSIGNITGDYYIADFVIITLAAYFLIVTWYYAYPYSLINTYINKVRPVIGKEETNGENV